MNGSSGELRNGKPRMVQVFRPCEIRNDGSSVSARYFKIKRYSLDIGFRLGSLRLLYRTGMLREGKESRKTSFGLPLKVPDSHFAESP
uniref:Uncharacterized protein n=1 Tax=Rhizophagus irregularis (strain DAOM 181602 / DAOM 197198 / MUCL 43194) TaxID=747089 RepID=U9TH76_RHIID